MSRLDELKKQHKDLALSDLDLMKMAVPDQASKYVDVLAKLAKIKYKEITETNSGEDNLRKACVSVLTEWGIDYNYLETLETPVLWALWNRMEHLLGQNNFKLFLKFANLNERKLINNNDVTSYKSFDEIEQAVSLAEIKLIDKELEKQIVKVYEDDEWLILKPLSLEASMKYGASTKWCTTMDGGRYFARYSRWGILLYVLNKQTGFKFATFKNLDRDRDPEFSFWNAADSKIDPLDTPEIPTEILGVIRNEVKSNVITNKNLMNEQTQKLLNKYENESETYTANEAIGNIFTYTTANTANFALGDNTPSAQLAISGNIEINDGDLILRSNGEERMRITSSGGAGIGTVPLYQGERALEQALNGEQPDEQYRVNPPETLIDARDRFNQAIAERLEQAHNRVVEERAQQRLLLESIDLGTLDAEYKRRLQQLAGINSNSPVTAVDDVYDPTTDPLNALWKEEQPDAPNWFTRLKNKLWRRSTES